MLLHRSRFDYYRRFPVRLSGSGEAENRRKEGRTTLFAANSQSTRPNTDMKLIKDVEDGRTAKGQAGTNELTSETNMGFKFVFFA